MEEELIQEYLRRFNKAFSLLNNDSNSSNWHIELTEQALRENQQEYADRMLQGCNSDSDVFSSGALIFWGYRLGAVRLKGKNEYYTRQGGYIDNAIWRYNLDEILNQDTEDDNPDKCSSHIIEWTINPGSNTDVSEEVLGKMIIPMVNNLCKITPPGKRTECTIVLPPISKKIEIQDWASLFGGLMVKDLQINIVNYGHLLHLNEDERKYIVQHQTDGYKEYVIISAYELIRGHNTCLGCLAFDVNDADHQYVLQDIKPFNMRIDNRQEKYNRKEKVELISDWKYLNCKYPVSNGFNSFLGNHAASFGSELYKLSGYDDIQPGADIIKKIFHENEALQTTEVCAKLMEENNLYNIALGDLVYVANILQKSKAFKTVLIGTKKAYKLGTYKQFASSLEIDKLHQIPANYACFTWKVRDKRKVCAPYFKLDIRKHSEKQIIESVIDHFEHCTTSIVADEILYLYKDAEDPSAFFVAKVFMYLSQMESLEIESRNEIISYFENVDNVKYKEIDKSHIKAAKTITKSMLKSNVFKKQKLQNYSPNTPIDEMEFTVRTYNCLRRAGMRTVGDITKKNRKDLMKVRNLGRSCQEEVIKKLHKMGLKLLNE